MILASGSIGASAVGAFTDPGIISRHAASTLSQFRQNSNGLLSSDNISGPLTANLPKMSQTVLGALSADNITSIAATSTMSSFTQTGSVGAVFFVFYGSITSSMPLSTVRLKGYSGPLSGVPRDDVLNNACHTVVVNEDVLTAEITNDFETLEVSFLCP